MSDNTVSTPFKGYFHFNRKQSLIHRNESLMVESQASVTGCIRTWQMMAWAMSRQDYMNISVQEPPLDYSFRSIHVIQDLISEEPRPGLRPLRHSKSGKPLTQSLRLNNNVLNELKDFKQVLSQLLEHPENLAWIDLSFNDLTSIDPVSPQLYQSSQDGSEATYPAPSLSTSRVKEVMR